MQKYLIYVKSQPVPEASFEKGIRVAFGNNFLKLIEKKDFYQAVFV